MTQELQRFYFFSEYQRCYCKFGADEKDKVPELCPAHRTQAKFQARLPWKDKGEHKIGYTKGYN
jgi:hypothetical protein